MPIKSGMAQEPTELAIAKSKLEKWDHTQEEENGALSRLFLCNTAEQMEDKCKSHWTSLQSLPRKSQSAKVTSNVGAQT